MKFPSRMPKVQICHRLVKKPVILLNRESKNWLTKASPRNPIEEMIWKKENSKNIYEGTVSTFFKQWKHRKNG